MTVEQLRQLQYRVYNQKQGLSSHDMQLIRHAIENPLFQDHASFLGELKMIVKHSLFNQSIPNQTDKPQHLRLVE